MSYALSYFIQEGYLFFTVLSGLRVELHVDVCDAGQAVGNTCEILVVGDEEGQASGLGDDVLQDGLGNGGAVVGAGAAAELVEDDEAAGGGGAQDAGRLGDLDHECGFAGEEVVSCARAGVDGVAEGEGEGVGGDEGADLGEEDDEGDGADKGRFAAHVRAGDEVC